MGKCYLPASGVSSCGLPCGLAWRGARRNILGRGERVQLARKYHGPTG